MWGRLRAGLFVVGERVRALTGSLVKLKDKRPLMPSINYRREEPKPGTWAEHSIRKRSPWVRSGPDPV